EDAAQPRRGHRGWQAGRARDLGSARTRGGGTVSLGGAVDARLAQARAWLRQDPDAETRDELAVLITRAASGDEAARHDLDDRFRTRLAFGTAGLRGALGAGSN